MPKTMNLSLEQFEADFEKNKDTLVRDYFEYLKFKTISAQTQYQPEMKKCVSWLEARLKKMGLAVSIWETSKHPTIFAQNLDAGKNAPTVLFYLHYDVQPVDPLELWETDPFEPTLKGDLVFARGSSDNKGQAFYTLSALDAVYRLAKKYPLNIKVVIEGEEEVGSTGLFEILPERKKDLQADYLVIVDSDTPDATAPTVAVGFRGIITSEITLKGTRSDLHSGLYGGVVYNPIQALCEILSKFHDKNGKVTIPHFYEGVRELSPKERGELYLDFDEKEFIKEHGVKPTGGEKSYSPLERMGLRPTFEINGIWGGYTEEGFKTVIPSLAHAKVSMRLVPDQDPDQIRKNYQEYIQSLVPDGLTLTLSENHGAANGFWADFDSTVVKAASRAIEDVFKKTCKKFIGGGSLPIGHALNQTSGAQTIALGLGLSTDQIHAPNEHFSISRIKNGYLMISQLLEQLSKS